MASMRTVSFLAKTTSSNSLMSQNRTWTIRKDEFLCTRSSALISNSSLAPSSRYLTFITEVSGRDSNSECDNMFIHRFCSIAPGAGHVVLSSTNIHSTSARRRTLTRSSKTWQCDSVCQGRYHKEVSNNRFLKRFSTAFKTVKRPVSYSSSYSFEDQQRIFCSSKIGHLSQQIRFKSYIPKRLTVVTASEMKKFMSDREINAEQGHTCFKLTCPSVTKEKISNKDQVFVNLTTGYFLCLSCRKSGDWETFQDNIGVLQLDPGQKRKKNACSGEDVMTEEESEKMQKIWREAEPVDENSDIDDLLNEFDIKELNKATLKAFSVRVRKSPKQLILPVFWERPLSDRNLLGLKILTKKNEKIVESTHPSYRQSYWGMFGMNTVTARTNQVIITANEFDAMIVHQELKQTVLSLPHGYETLPQEALPFLEQFDNIVLWFGTDITGLSAAKHLAKKLIYKRCALFRPVTSHMTPLNALKNGENLPNILRDATPASHQFIQHFKDLRLEAQAELSLVDQVKGIPFVRFPQLTNLLKGHRKGELTIVTGPTGSGKTTFISELSLDLCMQDVSTLWGSFEIKNVRLMKTMLTQFARKNLAEHLDEFDFYADKFEQLPLYFMAFHGQESLSRVEETMSHAVYMHDISHVIVDNLQFMMGVGDTRSPFPDRYSKQDEIVAAFRRFATSKNCHVTLVIHPRKEPKGEHLHISSIFGSAKASQEADNILLLQVADDAILNKLPKKYIQVVKNRFDGDLGSMLLKFDKESLSFGKDPSASKAAAKLDSRTILHSSHEHSEYSVSDADEEYGYVQ